MADGDYERTDARRETIRRLERKLEQWKKIAEAGRDNSDS